MIFYRENCADMALCEDDIDPEFIADTRAVVVTGTHLSHPRTEAAVLKALRLARANGARTALDIDYRPNLWGLAGHAEGEERFVESAEVTAKLQSTLHLFDLDRRHRGGVPHRRRLHRHPRRAPRRPRRLRRDADLQARRRWAPRPSTAPIPDSLDDGQTGPGFPIEVFNVLGAGDGFMSGLLTRLADRPGLADGADVRQRLRRLRRLAPRLHPGLPVLGGARSSSSTAASGPRRCARTPSSSRSTGRPTGCATGRRCTSSPSTTACSSRRSPTSSGQPHDRIGAFKRLCLEAAREVAAGRQRLRHPLRRPPRPRRALCRRRLRASGSAARSSCPAAARCGSSRDRARLRLGARRMAARARGQGALLLPPATIRPSCRAEQEATVAPPLPRHPRQPARVPARDHPRRKVARRHRHHLGRDHPALLRPRRLSRLVEARADDRPTPPGRTPSPPSPATTPTPAASSCSASRRRPTSSPRSFAVAAPARSGQGLRRRPHHLRRRRPRLARRQASPTQEAIADMAAQIRTPLPHSGTRPGARGARKGAAA